MTIPSKRQCASRTRRGRSHEALKTTRYGLCPKCKQIVRPHRACAKCGEYKGRTVLNTNKKIKKVK